MDEERQLLPFGDVAILSVVDQLDSIVSVSGKFGGVAGVFAGVISCKKTWSPKLYLKSFKWFEKGQGISGGVCS